MPRRMSFRALRLSVSIALTLLVLAGNGCGAGSDLFLSPFAGSADFDSMAQEVLTLTNQERAKAGLSALTWNDKLAQSGADHCQDMIDNNYFDHYSPSGSTPGDRATAAGYRWLTVGENIAAGYNTPETVMEGWMNSPDHKKNILLPDYRELGVGIRVSRSGRYYWAQEFGTSY